jgi:hypothetical protein
MSNIHPEELFETSPPDANSFEEIQVIPERVPGEQSHEHMRKKAILADLFYHGGGGDIEFERKTEHGLIFDVVATNAQGERVACEVGDLNTPSRKLGERLQNTYKSVDTLIWWPKSSDGVLFPERYVDAFRTVSDCQECLDAGERPAVNSVDLFPVQFASAAQILVIYLEHLFEPTRFHAKHEDTVEEDAQMTLLDFNDS